MFINSSYFLEEGKEAAEGTVVRKCRFCKGTFAIPKDHIQPDMIDVCDCAACKEAYAKQQAEDAKAGEGSTDITKALGC